MYECCTVSIYQRMANEHKPDGVCCLVSKLTAMFSLNKREGMFFHINFV